MTDTGQRTEVVLYDVADGIATLTLNRPDRLNAWTSQMQRELFDGLDRAGADPGVRVIVITGAGRGFCAGADMDTLQGIGDGEREEPDPRLISHPTTIPKPIICAINGPCAGIGFAFTLQCDLRFAAAGAKFTTAFSRRGLIAEHGMSWTLPRLVGPARALDVLFSARVFLAEEAGELGIVNKVFPGETLMDETYAYARELATFCSPASMAIMKAQIYRHLEWTATDAIIESNKLMVESFSRPDFPEGVKSFVEKREPRFPPLTHLV
jgi:enoyl-CoA hydratase/carnithine racemase